MSQGRGDSVTALSLAHATGRVFVELNGFQHEKPIVDLTGTIRSEVCLLPLLLCG